MAADDVREQIVEAMSWAEFDDGRIGRDGAEALLCKHEERLVAEAKAEAVLRYRYPGIDDAEVQRLARAEAAERGARDVGLWSKRPSSSGVFDNVRASGDPFKGVRREN